MDVSRGVRPPARCCVKVASSLLMKVIFKVNVAIAATLFAACSGHSSPPSPPAPDPAAEQATKDRLGAIVLPTLDALVQAATEMRDAAPVQPDRGWDPTLDPAAIDTMKQAWIRAHDAYERVEVAVE